MQHGKATMQGAQTLLQYAKIRLFTLGNDERFLSLFKRFFIFFYFLTFLTLFDLFIFFL